MFRTTLTLDDDVAARIKRVRVRRRASLKAVVNEALRAGLEAIEQAAAPAPFATATVSLGHCLVGEIDDVHGILSLAEGDDRA